MTFGDALEILKAGGRVRRRGWNGRGMWLAVTTGLELPTGALLRGAARLRAEEIVSEEGAHDKRTIRTGDHIDMRTADGAIAIGWTASQADMLSEDWEVV